MRIRVFANRLNGRSGSYVVRTFEHEDRAIDFLSWSIRQGGWVEVQILKENA